MMMTAVALGIAVVMSAQSAAVGSEPASIARSVATDSIATTSGDVTIMGVWQRRYYEDRFTSKTTCDKRGYAMKYYEEIDGFLNWQCHKVPGDTKWSMDVYWST